jgi:hypothetical protein
MNPFANLAVLSSYQIGRCSLPHMTPEVTVVHDVIHIGPNCLAFAMHLLLTSTDDVMITMPLYRHALPAQPPSNTSYDLHDHLTTPTPPSSINTMSGSTTRTGPTKTSGKWHSIKGSLKQGVRPCPLVALLYVDADHTLS